MLHATRFFNVMKLRIRNKVMILNYTLLFFDETNTQSYVMEKITL